MRTLRRSALLVLVLAAAGCGSGGPQPAPRLPAQVAAALAARSDAVAQRLEQGDTCRARAEAEALQSDTIAAVNAGRVPARYQEELVSSTAALIAAIECVPAVADEDEDEDEGKRKGKSKDKDRDEEDGDEEEDD